MIEYYLLVKFSYFHINILLYNIIFYNINIFENIRITCSLNQISYWLLDS